MAMLLILQQTAESAMKDWPHSKSIVSNFGKSIVEWHSIFYIIFHILSLF